MKCTEHEEKMTGKRMKPMATCFLYFFILSPQKLQNLKPIFLVSKFIVFMLDYSKCSTAGFKSQVENLG